MKRSCAYQKRGLSIVALVLIQCQHHTLTFYPLLLIMPLNTFIICLYYMWAITNWVKQRRARREDGCSIFFFFFSRLILILKPKHFWLFPTHIHFHRSLLLIKYYHSSVFQHNHANDFVVLSGPSHVQINSQPGKIYSLSLLVSESGMVR